jgi:hypothetical protein
MNKSEWSLERIKKDYNFMEKIKYGEELEDSEEKNYLFREYLQALKRDKMITEEEYEEWQYSFHPNQEKAKGEWTQEDKDYYKSVVNRYKEIRGEENL